VKTQVFVLLEYPTTLLGDWRPTFRESVVVSASSVGRPIALQRGVTSQNDELNRTAENIICKDHRMKEGDHTEMDRKKRG